MNRGLSATTRFFFAHAGQSFEELLDVYFYRCRSAPTFSALADTFAE
jgi:hypothetical protein